MAISFLLNRFPENTFVAGGDFYQLLNPKENTQYYLYAWINKIGQGAFSSLYMSYPFYSILSFFSSIGFKSNAIASLYMFIILYTSFLSFYFSIKLLFPEIKKNLQIGSSFLYAFNNFTLVIFTYPWGFSHQFLFYIFVPPLVAIFIKILINQHYDRLEFLIYALILVLSITSLNNVAFLGGLFLLQFLIFVFGLLTRMVHVNKLLFVKIITIISLYIIIFIPFFLTSFGNLLSSAKGVNSQGVLGAGIDSWLRATSSNFLNSFLLTLDKFQFPWGSSFSLTLSCSYFIILSSLVLFFVTRFHKISIGDKKTQNAKLIFTVLLLLIVFIGLSVRIYSLFEWTNLFIYKLPFFNMFRSADKIFTFIPFIYVLLITLLISVLHLKDKLIYFILAILIAIPYPFFLGKIPSILAQDDLAKYKYVLKIPNEYNKVADIINADNKNTSVISLPYSVVNSIGWSNYPKWGLVGADVLSQLFNKYYITANYYDNPESPGALSFDLFNKRGQTNSSDLLKLIQKFSGEYILLHKDIEPEWIAQTKSIDIALNELETKKVIELTENNSYFKLYRLNSQYIHPLIYSSSGNVIFKKISPVRYQVQIKNIPRDGVLTFHQTFNKEWKIYPADGKEEIMCNSTARYSMGVVECLEQKSAFTLSDIKYLGMTPIFDDQHVVSEGYANSWNFNLNDLKNKLSKDQYRVNSDGTVNLNLTMYFRLQSYVDISIIFYGCMVLICVASIVFIKSKKIKAGKGGK